MSSPGGIGRDRDFVQYSSRARVATDQFRERQKRRAAFHSLHAKLPPELKDMSEARLLAEASDPALYNIVQLIYRSPTYEGEPKDHEFSRRTMEDHWRAGHDDAVATLAHPEVLTPPTEPTGVAIYDFMTRPEQPASAPSRKESSSPPSPPTRSPDSRSPSATAGRCRKSIHDRSFRVAFSFPLQAPPHRRNISYGSLGRYLRAVREGRDHIHFDLKAEQSPP